MTFGMQIVIDLVSAVEKLGTELLNVGMENKMEKYETHDGGYVFDLMEKAGVRKEISF